jgi:peroxiredoxin
MVDLTQLPSDLPVPQDDGAADHLVGRAAPDLTLRSTSGEDVRLSSLGPGRTVIYLYPMTGRPGTDLPQGWDDIPGARGCTTEACDFRDHHAELLDAGADRVFGLSSQDGDYQREAVDRLGLPFALLSDPGLSLARVLDLPTFEVDGAPLYSRLTLVIRDGAVEHVFYPVFPPNEHARQVLGWLHSGGTDDEERRQIWLSSAWTFVQEQLPPAPASVLEIGCGSAGGFVPRMLDAGYDAVGVDPVAPAGPHYRQLSFELMQPAGRVAAVVASTSLHHVGDLDVVLSAVTAMLDHDGTLVVVEWDWERFDEATARWCFDRLDPQQSSDRHSWMHHFREGWIESGLPWDDYLRAWTSDEGLHTGQRMVEALDRHAVRQSLSYGPYFFADLDSATTEQAEQAAIDAGLARATGIHYVARRPPR